MSDSPSPSESHQPIGIEGEGAPQPPEPCDSNVSGPIASIHEQKEEIEAAVVDDAAEYVEETNDGESTNQFDDESIVVDVRIESISDGDDRHEYVKISISLPSSVALPSAVSNFFPQSAADPLSPPTAHALPPPPSSSSSQTVAASSVPSSSSHLYSEWSSFGRGISFASSSPANPASSSSGYHPSYQRPEGVIPTGSLPFRSSASAISASASSPAPSSNEFEAFEAQWRANALERELIRKAHRRLARHTRGMGRGNMSRHKPPTRNPFSRSFDPTQVIMPIDSDEWSNWFKTYLWTPITYYALNVLAGHISHAFVQEAARRWTTPPTSATQPTVKHAPTTNTSTHEQSGRTTTNTK